MKKVFITVFVVLPTLCSCAINMNQGWKIVDVGIWDRPLDDLETILMDITITVFGVAMLVFPRVVFSWIKRLLQAVLPPDTVYREERLLTRVVFPFMGLVTLIGVYVSFPLALKDLLDYLFTR